MYKSINNLFYCPIDFHNRRNIVHNLRHQHPIEIPFVPSRQSQLFIEVRGPTIWNNVPEYIRNSPSLFSFKKNIKRHYIDSY